MVPLLPSTLPSPTRSLLPTTASLLRLTLVVSTWTCQRSSSCCPSSSLSSLPSSLPSSLLLSSVSSSTPRSDFWEEFWAPLAGSRVVSSTSSSTKPSPSTNRTRQANEIYKLKSDTETLPGYLPVVTKYRHSLVPKSDTPRYLL